MKKVLYGTSALVAVGALAVGIGGQAQAQEEPIQLSVGGYYHTAFGIKDQERPQDNIGGTRDFNFAQDVEIIFSGSTTLDNGITFGIQYQMEMNNNVGPTNKNADEVWMFTRGSFGQLRIGEVEDARQEITNFAPGATGGIFGVNTPFFIFQEFDLANTSIFNVTTYTTTLGNEDKMKAVYFSPRFNGFGLGASFAPDGDENGFGGGYPDFNGEAANDGGNVGQVGDEWAVGADWNGNFGDFGIRLAAGYVQGTLETCAATAGVQTCEDNPDLWHAGATVSYGGFSFGGGYTEADLIGAPAAAGTDLDKTAHDLGIAYGQGPWAVGLQWGRQEDTQADGTDDELNIYAINASYVLGPGITVAAQIDQWDFDSGNEARHGSFDDTTFMVGTALNF